MTPLSSSRRSTARVLRVLNYLAASAQPVSAATLVRECNIPKQTLYPMLKDMADHGFVFSIPETHHWSLGVAAFEIGSAYLRSEPLQRIGRSLLVSLTGEVQETTHLAVLHGNEVMYLLKNSPGPYAHPLISDVGVRLPAHLTAVGRAMLMCLNESQLRALYPSPDAFVRRTGRGSAKLSELRQVLREDRHRGYSYERDLTSEGVSCIAAPVRDPRGVPVASVGISFQTSHHDEGEHAAMAARVVSAAENLSTRIHGYVSHVGQDLLD